MKNILVTGCAGFIGFHLAKRLVNESYNVFGFDNVNDYYDVNLKKQRLKILQDLEIHLIIHSFLRKKILKMKKP